MDLQLAADLDDVTTRLMAAITELKAALRGAAPDHAELCKRRILLARLAGERLRFLSERIFPLLRTGPTASHRAVVRPHEQRLRVLFGESTRHIGEWGSPRITTDWPGYVADTRRMIALVENFLAVERREVYPLLTTLARAA